MTPIAVRATVTFHPRVGPLTLEVFGCASADDGSHVHDGFCQKYHHCEKGEGGQGSPPCLTMNESNTLFNRVGRMFSSAFTYGKESHGIQVALGTEAPMTYPPLMELEPSCDGRENNGTFICWNASLTQRFYEGVFTRLMKSKQPIAWYDSLYN